MAYPVKIDTINQPFTTQKAALEYFDALKERNPIGQILTGMDALEVTAVYAQYCRVTNYPIAASIVGFSVDNKAQETSPGNFSTQKCFWYHLQDGSKQDFSMIKAVKKISQNQNA